MKPNLPHILITNDDGIHAPGIRHLWNALSTHAKLTVVAPSSEQSAVGLSTTIRHPLRLEKVCWTGASDIWCVTGTPADCVKLALNVIFEKRPDLVVSGINRGSNSGRNILYSGTVGAAIESVMQDIPAIAFSCRDYYSDPNFLEVERYIPSIVRHVLDHPLPKGSLLNVNFPEKELGAIKGFKMTRQGKEYWAENPDKRTHPSEGHAYYWLGAKVKNSPEAEDSDISWLRKGYIAAVPIHIDDLTDHRHLEKAKDLFESSFPS